MSIVISDTSPIRTLHHLDLLELLPLLFERVLVPPAVVAELMQPRRRLPSIDVASLHFIEVQAPLRVNEVEALAETLQLGEAEALVLAKEVGADLVLMDERDGRETAMRMGLEPLGVLGILLRGKAAGALPAVAPLLDSLANDIGFYLSKTLREDVLRAADEG